MSPSRNAWRRSSFGGGVGPVAAGLLCAAALTGLAASASALPLISFSADVRGLYGSAVGGEKAVDFYGPGIGLRAGVSLPLGWYVGASVDHYFGVDVDAVSGDSPIPEFKTSQTQFLGHLGLDWGIGPLSLRPTLGAGFSMSDIDVSAVGADAATETTSGAFTMSPGAEFIVSLGLFTIGAELRYNYVFRDDLIDLATQKTDKGAIIYGFGFGLSI